MPGGTYVSEGILGFTFGSRSPLSIVNSGDITANADATGVGIAGFTEGGNRVSIENSGDITANAAQAVGIVGFSKGGNSPVNITNSGELSATSVEDGFGIRSYTLGDNSHLTIVNDGDVMVAAGRNAFGIFAQTQGSESRISIENSGDIATMSDLAYASGIFAESYSSGVSIENKGNISAIGSVQAMGILAQTRSGSVNIVNNGDITTSASDNAAVGIFSQTYGGSGDVAVKNSGDISVASRGRYAGGIVVMTGGASSGVSITNSGHITASLASRTAVGIYSQTFGDDSGIAIDNSGDLWASGLSKSAGILARASGSRSPVSIVNSGSAYGGYAGIYATSATRTTIANTGKIWAGSHLAIETNGGPTSINNAGTITGLVDLTENNDLFVNQSGGVFETKMTSLFGGGSDLFRNEAGGTVQAASNASAKEMSAFQGLETFKNMGTISTLDGGTGDVFTISNTPSGKDLNFVGSGNSTLAVDAFLGGPGNSSADVFTIEGNVSGTTTVAVNNTNTGPGVFNSTGSPVVFVTGKTPTGNEFSLAEPIDTGFFDYDLFFTPTGSGFWSLKSFPAGGAFLLPQLVTAAQDIWHQTSSTWFDRTADLRVLLAGGAAPTAYDPGGKSLGDGPNGNFTPAVWARGSGSWLDRDDTERTTAYGRNYTIDLDRDLDTIDFQVGIDMGTRDPLSAGDVLVFGMLGGFVHADLDYDQLARQFDFSGGQVGAYATYLKGGLFVDTLLNVHLYELDTATLGFPSSLDANTVGLRTDTGYRFGSFSGGMFIEPLATIEVTWADIDGFSLSGNTVSFDNEANVRGRLGLRAGTTTEAWTGTMMEPFVTGSLWGNLTDDNSATLVSTRRTFRFEDQLDDVWGEVSAGVNFFNFSQTTAVFAKVDVTFGDDVSGVGGKAGMRVSW